MTWVRVGWALGAGLLALLACSGQSASNAGTGGSHATGGAGSGGTNNGGTAALAAFGGAYGGSGAKGPNDGGIGCGDYKKDNTETDVDCGGMCGGCGGGKNCVFGSDCVSDYCVDGVCCGKPCQAKCESCTTGLPGECATLGGSDPDNECPGADVCGSPGHCQCFDGYQELDETGVDCGGPCPPCGGTCSDGVQNNGETDIDCGGTVCTAKCSVGMSCEAESDCGNLLCFKGKCCQPEPDGVTCAGVTCGNMTGNCGQIANCGPLACGVGQLCLSGNCQAAPWLFPEGGLGGAAGAGGGM